MFIKFPEKIPPKNQILVVLIKIFRTVVSENYSKNYRVSLKSTVKLGLIRKEIKKKSLNPKMVSTYYLSNNIKNPYYLSAQFSIKPHYGWEEDDGTLCSQPDCFLSQSEGSL